MTMRLVDDESAGLTLTVSGGTSAAVSLLAICHVLVASGDALQAAAKFFPDVLDADSTSLRAESFLECSDLLFGEAILRPADGAMECIIQPSDWYLDLVAAIALSGDVSRDVDLHGWPVLSVGGGTPTVADAGGVASASGGGVV